MISLVDISILNGQTSSSTNWIIQANPYMIDLNGMVQWIHCDTHVPIVISMQSSNFENLAKPSQTNGFCGDLWLVRSNDSRFRWFLMGNSLKSFKSCSVNCGLAYPFAFACRQQCCHCHWQCESKANNRKEMDFKHVDCYRINSLETSVEQ